MKACPKCSTKCLNSAECCQCGYPFVDELPGPGSLSNTDVDKLRQAVQEIETLERGEKLPQVSVSGHLPHLKAASPAPQLTAMHREAASESPAPAGSSDIINHHHLMKARQKQVLIVGIAVAVLMGVFPPWTDSFLLDSGAQGKFQSQSSVGYSFIFDPPQAQPQMQMFHTFAIDIRRLFVEWVVVALAVGGGLVYFREPVKKSENSL